MRILLSCQIALYPLAAKDTDKVIIEALKAIKPFEKKGLTVEVGSMSTVIKGPDKLVWEVVQVLFNRAAGDNQKIVLNMQVSNECGCD